MFEGVKMKLVNFLPENLYQFSLKLQWGGQTYLTIQWKTRVTLLSTLRVYEDYVSKTFCLKKKRKKREITQLWCLVCVHGNLLLHILFVLIKKCFEVIC